MTGKLANTERIAILEKRMIENLDLIENIWLKDKPFLCGNEISISDLVGACEVEQPSEKIFYLRIMNLRINFLYFHFRNWWF